MRILALAASHARVLGLREREAHPERIAARQRGEDRGVVPRRDEAADRLLRTAGDAADRRRHRRIGKVELGLPHACARHLYRRARLLEGGARLVGLLLANGAPVGEPFQALGLLRREVLASNLLRQRAARLRELDLEGRALDLEERRARSDALALVVELALDDAGDARAHLHFARALGAADRLEYDRHLARRHVDHGHRQRGRRRFGVVLLLLGIALAAGGERQASERNE